MICLMLILFPVIGPMPRETVEPPAIDTTRTYDEYGPISLTDSNAFGITKKQAYDGWQFAASHLRWIESRWWDTAGWEMSYFYWVREADCLEWTWYHLYRSLCDDSDDCRLEHLKKLRSRIGIKAYYCGEMPPPAPY